MAPQIIKDEFLPTFKALGQDDQDSVRLLIVDVCVSFANIFKSSEDNVTIVLPMVKSCYQDKSWRVRFMVADKFCDVTFPLSLLPFSLFFFKKKIF